MYTGQLELSADSVIGVLSTSNYLGVGGAKVRALVRWTEHDEAGRRDTFTALMLDANAIRLPHIAGVELGILRRTMTAMQCPAASEAIVDESLRRNAGTPLKSRPRRYLPPPGQFVTPTTCERTLTGHTGSVLALTMCGDKLVSRGGVHDKTIKMWDTATWECERTPTGHTEIVWALAMCGDKLAASCCLGLVITPSRCGTLRAGCASVH